MHVINLNKNNIKPQCILCTENLNSKNLCTVLLQKKKTNKIYNKITTLCFVAFEWIKIW